MIFKVENFPPQEELRAIMVEHSLQGEDGSLSIIDFIAAGLSLTCTEERVWADIKDFQTKSSQVSAEPISEPS